MTTERPEVKCLIAPKDFDYFNELVNEMEEGLFRFSSVVAAARDRIKHDEYVTIKREHMDFARQLCWSGVPEEVNIDAVREMIDDVTSEHKSKPKRPVDRPPMAEKAKKPLRKKASKKKP